MRVKNLTTVLLAFLIHFQGCAKSSLVQNALDNQRAAAGNSERQLIQCLKERDTAKVKALLSEGVNPNATERTDSHGVETALDIAVYTENTDAVLMLIRHGANVNGTGYLNRTPLFQSRAASIARVLLDAGTKVNARDGLGETPLMHAPYEVARLLIERGADVNVTDDEGFTALSVTAEYGEVEKIRLLLENGADVDARAKNGWTALIAAGSRSSSAAAELLLKHGANPNAEMNDGFTALMRAAMWNSAQTARVLLKHGANPEAMTEDGDTALSIAITSSNQYRSHRKIIDLLRRARGVT